MRQRDAENRCLHVWTKLAHEEDQDRRVAVKRLHFDHFKPGEPGSTRPSRLTTTDRRTESQSHARIPSAPSPKARRIGADHGRTANFDGTSRRRCGTCRPMKSRRDAHARHSAEPGRREEIAPKHRPSRPCEAGRIPRRKTGCQSDMPAQATTLH